MDLMSKQDGRVRLAQLFRALAHPVRLRILEALAQQQACVCHLTALLGRPQPYVSQQLATLREAGLVADRREGTLNYYRLSDEGIAELLRRGKGLLETGQQARSAFPDLPQGPLTNCPCPHCTTPSGTSPPGSPGSPDKGGPRLPALPDRT
jgi:ArsR family transcriptional regulator